MLRVKHFGSLIATPSSTGVWCCLDALAHQSALMRRRPHGWRDRRRQVRSRRRRARDARGLPPASLPSKLEAGITIIASPSSRKRHPPGFTVLSAARSAFEVLQWKMRGLKEAADQNSRSAPLAPVLFGAVPGAAFACAPMHTAIGGEFATKPSCERPGLEHRQYGILRVLPYHSAPFRRRGQTSACRAKSVRGSAAPGSMSLSMPRPMRTRPIRHTRPWLFSAAPVVAPTRTRSPSRPCDRGRAATPPRRAMRFEGKSTMPRAPRDYAMYDWAKAGGGFAKKSCSNR
jgi:hypothetical protein